MNASYSKPDHDTSVTALADRKERPFIYVFMEVIWKDTALTSTQKLVALGVASFADNDTGKGFPNVDTIAERCALARRTVQNALPALEALGFISTVKNAGWNGANLYQCVVPKPVDVAHSRGAAAAWGGAAAAWGGAPDSEGGASGSEMSASAAPKLLITTQELLSLSQRQSANDEIQTAFDEWNETAERAGLPKAQKLTKSRKQKVAARLRDAGGLAGWRDALAKVEASPFLTGQARNVFHATLDFILKRENFTKLMEGNYADGTKGSPAKRNQTGGRGPMAFEKNTGRGGRRTSHASEKAQRILQEGG